MVQEDKLHSMNESDVARERQAPMGDPMLAAAKGEHETPAEKSMLDSAKEKIGELETQAENALKHTKEAVEGAAHSVMQKLQGNEASKLPPAKPDEHEKTAEELARDRDVSHGGDPLLNAAQGKQ